MDFERVLSLLAADILYHNIPMEPVRGREAVRTFIDSFEGLESVDWQIIHIASSGNAVLTERIDEFIVQGSRVVVPVMGVFEVSTTQIQVWRDYFDLQGFLDQMPTHS